MKTDYIRLIFGEDGLLEVKKLFAKEFREKRQKIGVSTEELDTLFVKHGYKGAKVGKIEENPTLLDSELICGDHAMSILFNESDEVNDRSVTLSGEYVSPLITKWLNENPEHMAKVLEEFHRDCKNLHVTVWPEGLKTNADFVALAVRILHGEHVFKGGINSVTPLQWARVHVYCSIIRQLDRNQPP